MKKAGNDGLIANSIFIMFVLLMLFAVTTSKNQLTGNAMIELKRPTNLMEISNEVKSNAEITSKSGIAPMQKIIPEIKKRGFFADFFKKTSNIITFKKPAAIPLKSSTLIEQKQPEILPEIEITVPFGDSDNGINETVFGSCRDFERVINDACSEIWPNVLMEAYEKEMNLSNLNKTYCTLTAVYCKNNCSNGICLNEEDAQPIPSKAVIPLSQ